MESNCKITGKPEYVMKKPDGTITWRYTPEHNQVQDNLKNQTAAWFATGSAQTFGYGKCGTGSGATTSATNLTTPITGDRTAITSKTRTDNKVEVKVTFGAGTDTGTIEEVGLFATATGTDMLVYDDSISKSKGADDILEVTWTITFG